MYLLKKNKVSFLPGHGSFVAKEASAGTRSRLPARPRDLAGKQVIVATGSKRRVVCRTCRSTRSIVLDQRGRAEPAIGVPKKLAVIGAGVIGLEMGSVWRRLSVPESPSSSYADLPGLRPTSRLAKEAIKAFDKPGF